MIWSDVFCLIMNRQRSVEINWVLGCQYLVCLFCLFDLCVLSVNHVCYCVLYIAWYFVCYFFVLFSDLYVFSSFSVCSICLSVFILHVVS